MSMAHIYTNKCGVHHSYPSRMDKMSMAHIVWSTTQLSSLDGQDVYVTYLYKCLWSSSQLSIQDGQDVYGTYLYKWVWSTTQLSSLDGQDRCGHIYIKRCGVQHSCSFQTVILNVAHLYNRLFNCIYMYHICHVHPGWTTGWHSTQYVPYSSCLSRMDSCDVVSTCLYKYLLHSSGPSRMDSCGVPHSCLYHSNMSNIHLVHPGWTEEMWYIFLHVNGCHICLVYPGWTAGVYSTHLYMVHYDDLLWCCFITPHTVVHPGWTIGPLHNVCCSVDHFWWRTQMNGSHFR